MHREPEVLEADCPSGKMVWLPCKDYLKGTCTTLFCEKWHPPECLFYKSENDADLCKSALMHTARLMNSLAKGSKRMVTKVQWLWWKLHDNWVAYFKMWSSRSLQRFCGRAQTYWSQSDVFDSLKPCYVMLKFETRIHRSEWFAHVILISVNPMLQNLRIGLKKRRNGKSDVPVKQRGGWPKICEKLKEKHETAFFSPSENWCLPASSTLKPKEREFVVDPGASMHMIGKKDLNFAELETVTTSKSPTTVFTANGEVQTNEEATVYGKKLEKFLTLKVLEDTPVVLSLGKLCDEHGYSYEWINGQKPHLIKNGIRIQRTTENFVPIVVSGLSTSSSSSLPTSPPMTPSRQEIDHSKSSSNSSTSTPMTSSMEIEHSDHPPAIVSSESVDRQVRRDPYGTNHHPAIVSSESVERQVRWDPYSSETSEELLNTQSKSPKQNKNENHEQVRGDPYYSDIPEWLQDFRKNLVYDRVPEHRDSHASSSHELSLEPTKCADLGKHSVHTHFQKNRHCDICQRTKITRAPCRRRIGRVVPRAENFGDLITAYDKVLSEGCESRNNHRYAVVVQDLATPWIQSCPCKTKTSQETQRSLQSSWSQIGNLKSVTRTIPWNSAKPVKISPGIIVRQHHTDRKQMGLLREQCAEWKKVRMQYCCNEVWMKNGGQIPWNVPHICETLQISYLMGRLHTKDVLENQLKDQSFRLVHWLSITLFLRKTSQESINLERKYYRDCSLDTLCTSSEFGRVT